MRNARGSRHSLYALDGTNDKYKALLQSIDLYKVGQHGSWNATPKKLWKLFTKKSARSEPARLKTLMSTLEGMKCRAESW